MFEICPFHADESVWGARLPDGSVSFTCDRTIGHPGQRPWSWTVRSRVSDGQRTRFTVDSHGTAFAAQSPPRGSRATHQDQDSDRHAGIAYRDIPELQFICHATAVPSILRRGVMSHNEVANQQLSHRSVAEAGVQARRSTKRLQCGLPLHDCANLYFNARNAMLFRVVKESGSQIVVLGVHKSAMLLPGARVTLRNAAVGEGDVQDYSPEEGLAALCKQDLFADRWGDDPGLKGRMMAEVLVPGVIPPHFVEHAYAPTAWACAQLREACPELDVRVDRRLFFDLMS
jgi:hypothetical protein